MNPIFHSPALTAMLAVTMAAALGACGDTAKFGGGGKKAPAAKADTVQIRVLSNRADLISGGDALVEIVMPEAAKSGAISAKLGGRDVSDKFALRDNGRVMGLVEGLDLGTQTLEVKLPDGLGAVLALVNHPNGGPVFSGPHVLSWVCQATAEDELCNEPARYEFYYKSASGFTAFDPASPPASMPTTTTDEGKTVPYIVRVETGYMDRDQYRIAVLYDPAQPWSPWAPQPGWNRKLLIPHGASCGIDHQAGSAPDVLNDAALSRGFAVMSTALNNAGHNCNVITQAESLVMAKERLVEQLGELRYTIGTGCSGGSLTQQQVANAYPGVYQGILPACSFPDAWSTGQQLVDYHLTRKYLENPLKWGTGIVWEPLSIAAIDGHPNHVNSIILDTLYLTALGDPVNACAGVTAEERYHPLTNPAGARCTLADYTINVVGPRPPEVWTENEKALGRGFAGRPLDNVGVQYGLEALKRGQITVAQFVDINAKVGGADIDVNLTPERTTADEPALANAYRSGGINQGNNLKDVAIIDLRGPDPGAFHDAYRSWATRARLEREQGHFKNHVIWFGAVPLLGDLQYATQGLVAMDRWLAAVEADTRSEVPLSQKIIDNRPSDIQDRCLQIDGIEAVTVPGIGTVCELDLVQTRFGTPRTVAGESIATDTNKCALKPLRRTDYYPVEFTDVQWEQLQTAFPTGVCDWSKPGISQQPTIPWMTYADTVGGRPLGEAPKSQMLGR